MTESFVKGGLQPDISPQDLERGRAAFLARIRSKLDTGDTSGIRAAAGRLLHFYEESPDRLDAEVSAQLKINSSDLLGDTGTNYYFKFSIWDNPTVNSGSKLWPSTDPTSFTVTVREGSWIR